MTNLSLKLLLQSYRQENIKKKCAKTLEDSEILIFCVLLKKVIRKQLRILLNL